MLKSTNLIHLALRKTMSRALLTVVLVAGFAAAAAPASTAASIQVRAFPPDTLSETAARMPLQPVAQPVVVIATGIVPELRSVPRSSVDSRSSTDESGWRSYGTLLATLVLMAAIALRRNKAWRP
jgi:hypothetical protein